MMQTRCPACATTFRITTEQLKLRQGRVRCGRCHYVFNALESLVVDEAAATNPAPSEIETIVPRRVIPPAASAPSPPPVPPAPAPRASPPAAAATPAPAAAPAAAPVAPSAPQAAPNPEPVPAATRKPAAAPPPEASKPSSPPPAPAKSAPAAARAEAAAPAPRAAAAAPPAVRDETPTQPPVPIPAVDGDFSLTSIDEVIYASDAPGGIDPIDFELPEIQPVEIPRMVAEPEPLLQAPEPGPAWPWTLGVVAALLLLCAQAIYVYRVELTVWQPDLRPLLAEACAALGCDLPLPRQIKLIDIESSDLAPDGSNRGRYRLGATLKNRADIAEQIPDLELTLTDTLDRPLASRVLSPADFLPPARDAGQGFKPREDLAISVPIEAVGLSPSGYRVYLFYP